MKNTLKKLINGFLNKESNNQSELTISQWWEKYAQDYKKESQSSSNNKLGDEWNESQLIGIDVPDNQIVSYLDEQVFSAFLGTVNVLLEIGPGGGRFTEVLLPKCNKLIAADTSPSMLNILKERFKNSDKINYLQLDGLGLSSIPDASVDAAFSYGVFVHLQHWDIYNYIAEISRVLVPGGKAIIQHSNTFSELGWERFKNEVRPSLNTHKLAGSFILMTPEIMEQFVQRSGLILENCRTDIVRRDCISLIKKPSN